MWTRLLGCFTGIQWVPGFLGRRKVDKAEDSWAVHSFEGPLVWDSKGHCETGTWVKESTVRLGSLQVTQHC